jgi:hypothetical protein
MDVRALARRARVAARDRAEELALRRREHVLSRELGGLIVRREDGDDGLEEEIGRTLAELRGTRAELTALEEARRARSGPPDGGG